MLAVGVAPRLDDGVGLTPSRAYASAVESFFGCGGFVGERVPEDAPTGRLPEELMGDRDGCGESAGGRLLVETFGKLPIEAFGELPIETLGKLLMELEGRLGVEVFGPADMGSRPAKGSAG